MRRIAGAILAVLGSSVARAGQLYLATDLGTLPGAPFTYGIDATAINNFGQVIGSAPTAGDGALTPILWTPQVAHGSTGSLTDLGMIPNTNFGQGGALGINDQGQVVGYNDGSNSKQAFLWNPSSSNATTGTMVGLPNRPDAFNRGQAAGGINDAGQIMGVLGADPGIPARGGQTAFIWSPNVPGGSTGNYLDLVNPASSRGSLFSLSNLNSAGQFVSNGYADASLWTPVGGAYTQTIIPKLSDVRALNERGQIIGNVATGGKGTAALWTPAAPNTTSGSTQLISLGQLSTVGLGLNNVQQVVGQYQLDGDGNYAAFVWDSINGATDLNTVLVNNIPGWTLTGAVGINDSGEIIATGKEFLPSSRGNGVLEVDHSFLLTPESVPEPRVVSALSLLAGVLCRSRSNHRRKSSRH